MKMNIKGLVFVGFAAAVFASAANADVPTGDTAKKTVTSVNYTEATYEKKGNKAQDLTATGDDAAREYPSVAAVKTALAETGATVQDGTLSIQVGSGTPTTFSANQESGTNVSVALGSAAGADTTTDTTLALSGETGKLPTAATVKTYVDNQISDIEVGEGTLSIQVGSGTPTTFSANEETGQTKTVTLGSAAGADTTTDTTLAASGETGKLPTAATVKTYVDSKVGSAYDDGTNVYFSTGANGETVVNAATIKLNGTAVPMDTTTHEIALTDTQYSADDVTIQKNASNQFSAKTGEITTGNETTLTTGAQVATYVNGLLAGTIPEATGCSTTAPCALVATGTNAFAWQPIQQ